MISYAEGKTVPELTKTTLVEMEIDGETKVVPMTEEERACRHFADRANWSKTFEFKAYGHQSVRDALNASFHFKCAYCESPYDATQPVAIEHYRPKGEVTIANRPVKPGYYWLASRWDNLLPSCTDCNSHRNHVCLDGRRRLIGKANLFPVADEAKRATLEFPLTERRRKATARQEATWERPLLLHPYLDVPETHLEFFVQDGLSLVRPRKARNGHASKKGNTTIEVVGLLRPGLVKRRSVQVRIITKAITTAAVALDELDRDPANRSQMLQLVGALRELEQLRMCDAPYAGMARQMIDPFLAAISPPG
jgi:hypothetical protein